MSDEDTELAAEVVCAVARAVQTAEPERLQDIPLGNTVKRLLTLRDAVPPGETDEYKLVALASAVERAKEGDAEARDKLPDLIRNVREWFGLRN